MQSAAASNNRMEYRMQTSNLGKTNYSREKTQTQICFTWLLVEFCGQTEAARPCPRVTQRSPDFPSASPVPECTMTLPGDGEQRVQSGNTETSTVVL